MVGSRRRRAPHTPSRRAVGPLPPRNQTENLIQPRPIAWIRFCRLDKVRAVGNGCARPRAPRGGGPSRPSGAKKLPGRDRLRAGPGAAARATAPDPRGWIRFRRLESVGNRLQPLNRRRAAGWARERAGAVERRTSGRRASGRARRRQTAEAHPPPSPRPPAGAAGVNGLLIPTERDGDARRTHLPAGGSSWGRRRSETKPKTLSNRCQSLG